MGVLRTKERTRVETVSLGEDGEFKIHLRRPTGKELIELDALRYAKENDKDRAADRTSRVTEFTLKNLVTGWSELYDEDENEIEYSWDRLLILFENYPSAFNRIDILAAEMSIGLLAESKKNLSETPSDSSAETPEQSKPSGTGQSSATGTD